MNHKTKTTVISRVAVTKSKAAIRRFARFAALVSSLPFGPYLFNPRNKKGICCQMCNKTRWNQAVLYRKDLGLSFAHIAGGY
jgi:hypothetical protein